MVGLPVSLIVGLGEVGAALYEVLAAVHPVKGFDDVLPSRSNVPNSPRAFEGIDYLHVCIPYNERFLPSVQRYIDETHARFCVVHSSVPVGTCAKLKGTVVFHSPVRGTHPEMRRGLVTFEKYLSSDAATPEEWTELDGYLRAAGFRVAQVLGTKTTELMKLLELARYGVYLAFAKEQEAICRHLGVDYDVAYLAFERSSNAGLREEGKAEMQQPLLTPFDKYIGGHCTLENMALLLAQCEQPLLRQAYAIGRGTTIWPNCNVYPGARIGKGCNVGQFTEIDDGVVIGNDVRIGAHCFIPSGVTIEDGCFIAPRVSFSNDKHPPSKRACWAETRVRRGAVIGVGSVILPGITIGERAVIGAGSVVTKDVPAGAVWYGEAARDRARVEDVYRPKEALAG